MKRPINGRLIDLTKLGDRDLLDLIAVMADKHEQVIIAMDWLLEEQNRRSGNRRLRLVK